MARSTRITDADYYDGNQLGYYRRTNLETMIDNFMVAYVGDGKVLPSVPRHEIAFWGQRAVQEFNYDTFHSESSLELELSPSLNIPLPNDYVNYIDIHKMDIDGFQRILTPATRAQSPRPIAQDENYEPIFDNEGNLIETNESESVKTWQNRSNQSDFQAREYYYGDYDNDYTNNYNTFYGRRYGLTPSDASNNGTFLLDERIGRIFFDGGLQENDVIVLKYISDGLGDGGDLANVFIPKEAEDAVYYFILSRLTELRTATAQLSSLYKRQAKAKMNNAKIRLMNLRPQELKNILRNKSKWIKH